VVAIQPNLSQILEFVVIGYLSGRKVAVIIDDRQVPREFVIKLDSGVAAQQEVLGDKCLIHSDPLLILASDATAPACAGEPNARLVRWATLW
jgi:hypothetical protein